jgi:hypothetical protein
MSLLLHPNGRRKAETFVGPPCAKCGEVLRYVGRGKRCVACQRKGNR